MIREPRSSSEEHARRGEEIYEQELRSLVEAENFGRIVAIDVDSNVVTTAQRLLARVPNAQIWCTRIGHRAVHTFGPRSSQASA